MKDLVAKIKRRAAAIRRRIAANAKDRKAIAKLRSLVRKRKAEAPKWISKSGAKFIRAFEGFSAKPYNDPAGYATVGIGHLLGYRGVTDADRRGVWIAGQNTPGQLSESEALELLRQDLRNSIEPAVRSLFISGPLRGKFEQPLYDALVSFAYNLGPGSLQGSPGFETLTAALRSGR